MTASTGYLVKTFKKHPNGTKTVSARLDMPMYESMIRAAELLGYTSVNKFLTDAIAREVSNVGAAMTSIAQDNMSEFAVN